MALQTNPVQSLARQRVAAWIAFALALVYPLTSAYYADTLLLIGRADVVTIVFYSLYNLLTFFEWPLPIVAIFLASLVLRDARGRNRVAWAAVILGALSILVIAGTLIVLAFFAHGQSASSTT